MGRYRKTGGTQAYLYCITDGEFVKIGWAVDPEKRRRDLQTGNPKKLKVVHKIRCKNTGQAIMRERNLHKLHRRYRVRSEWYTMAVLLRPFGKYKDEQPHVWINGVGLQDSSRLEKEATELLDLQLLNETEHLH